MRATLKVEFLSSLLSHGCEVSYISYNLVDSSLHTIIGQLLRSFL